MSQLELTLLGGVDVRLNGRSLSFASRKATALLAYLALTNATKSRSQIAALLWPESDEKSGRNALRYTLSVLQKELGKAWLHTTRQTLALPPNDELQIDVVAFQQAVEQEQWETAVQLYRGPFMAGFDLPDAPPFETWQRQQAERLRVLLSQAYAALLAEPNEMLPSEQKAQHAQRLLTFDPYSEIGYRTLMQQYAAEQQFSEALRVYEQCVAVLYAELGVDPEPETTAVYNQIVTARQAAQAVPKRPSLPAPPTDSFVGREAELRQLQTLFADGARLVTILGAGGMGKTRLATEAAQRIQSQFADGAAFVPLARAQTVEEVITAVGLAVGLSFGEGSEPLAQLHHYLRDRHLLLLLDNLEQLLSEAVLDLLADLLQTLPNLAILATSRERLRLHMEQLLPLRGLATPAEKLFIQRTAKYLPAAAIDADLVRHICQLVDGMPLALELAAAQTATLSLKDIAATIEQNLDVLRSPYHDSEARHQSVRAVLSGSWAELSPRLQQIMAGLALFQGGATLAAAQAVTAATVNDLQRLVEKSLLWPANGRYQMHELMRHFAAEQLEEQRLTIEQQHASYFCALVQSTERPFATEGFDNVRAAWSWLLAQRQTDAAIGMVLPLWRFYRHHRRFAEGARLLEQAIAQLAAPEADRAEWVRLWGMAFVYLGQITQGIAKLREATSLAGYPIPAAAAPLVVGCLRELGRLRLPSFGKSRALRDEAGLKTAVKATLTLTNLAYQNGAGLLTCYTALLGRRLAAWLNEPASLTIATANLHAIWRALGRQRLAEQTIQQTRHLLANHSIPPREQAIVQTSLVTWLIGHRPWADLVAEIDEAIGLAQQASDTFTIANATIVRSFLLMFQGDFAQNLANNRRFSELAEQAHNDTYRLWQNGIPTHLLRLGRPDEAAAMMRHAEALVARGTAQQHTLDGWLAAERATAVLWAGDAKKAAQIVQTELEPALAGLPFTNLILNAYVVAVEVWLAVSPPAPKRLRHALRRLWLFSQIHVVGKPSYHLYRGLFWARNGRLRRAKRQWQRGLAWATKLDMPFQEAKLLWEIGQATGDDTLMHQALQRFEELELYGEATRRKKIMST